MRAPKRIAAGPWLPDLPGIAIAEHGLRVADDGWPVDGGYGPAPSWIPQATVPMLPARARGGIGGVTFDGSSYNFQGTGSALYRLTASLLTDKSKVGGYALAADDRWEWDVFGNVAFAATPGYVLQYLDLLNLIGGTFADVPGGPRAKFVSTVRDHLVVGNLFGEPNAVQWSAIRNPTSWPVPGTDAAIAVQSGKNALGGSGGHVVGLVGGAEVGAVFQERAIWRMDYVGGDVMWEFSRVEPSRGLLAPGAAIDFGREVFFLAQDGLFRFDYTTARPVGQERVNRYVLDQLDPAHYDRIRMGHVPGRPIILMAFPGRASVGGLPDQILAYHWALDRFTRLVEPNGAEALYRWQPFTASLDDEVGSLDDESGSLDDEETFLSEQRMAWFNATHQLGTLSGGGRAALYETGLIEPAPGRRATLVEVRPLVEGLEATVAVAALGRSAAPIVFGADRAQDSDGAVPVRSDGRYHVLRVRIPSGDHQGFSGNEIVFRPSGLR